METISTCFFFFQMAELKMLNSNYCNGAVYVYYCGDVSSCTLLQTYAAPGGHNDYQRGYSVCAQTVSSTVYVVAGSPGYNAFISFSCSLSGASLSCPTAAGVNEVYAQDSYDGREGVFVATNSNLFVVFDTMNQYVFIYSLGSCNGGSGWCNPYSEFSYSTYWIVSCFVVQI